MKCLLHKFVFIEKLRCLGHRELPYTKKQQNEGRVGTGLQTMSCDGLASSRNSFLSDKGPLYTLGVVPIPYLAAAMLSSMRTSIVLKRN